MESYQSQIAKSSSSSRRCSLQRILFWITPRRYRSEGLGHRRDSTAYRTAALSTQTWDKGAFSLLQSNQPYRITPARPLVPPRLVFVHKFFSVCTNRSPGVPAFKTGKLEIPLSTCHICIIRRWFSLVDDFVYTTQDGIWDI